jgi:hypothetical protein
VGDVIKNRHVRHGWLSLKGLAMIMDSPAGCLLDKMAKLAIMAKMSTGVCPCQHLPH